MLGCDVIIYAVLKLTSETKIGEREGATLVWYELILAKKMTIKQKYSAYFVHQS